MRPCRTASLQEAHDRLCRKKVSEIAPPVRWRQEGPVARTFQGAAKHGPWPENRLKCALLGGGIVWLRGLE